MNYKKDYVAAIDIGTTKIVAILGKRNPNRKMEIVGMCKAVSKGVKRGVVLNIDETVMCADFKVLVRIFVNESRAAYCKPFFLGWQGYWANYMGTGAFSGFDNPLGRLVEDTMVISLKADADLLLRHILYIPI